MTNQANHACCRTNRTINIIDVQCWSLHYRLKILFRLPKSRYVPNENDDEVQHRYDGGGGGFVVCFLVGGGLGGGMRRKAPSHQIKNYGQTWCWCTKWCEITYSLEFFIRVLTSSFTRALTCLIVSAPAQGKYIKAFMNSGVTLD